MTMRDIPKAGRLNFISPCGLGDTMFLNQYRRALEKKYGLPIHLIIKPSHAVVMKMFANSDYSVHEFTQEELVSISRENPAPRPGMPYIAHPLFSRKHDFIDDWLRNPCRVRELLFRFFEIDKNTPAGRPVWYPDFQVRESLPDPSRSVLLLPEARSVEPLKSRFWEKYAARIRRAGLNPVQSFVNPRFQIENVHCLPDNLEIVIAFAFACVKVYSLRSGLCDLISGKVQNMTLFYTDVFSYKIFWLEKQFTGQILHNYPVISVMIKNQLKKLIIYLFHHSKHISFQPVFQSIASARRQRLY